MPSTPSLSSDLPSPSSTSSTTSSANHSAPSQALPKTDDRSVSAESASTAHSQALIAGPPYEESAPAARNPPSKTLVDRPSGARLRLSSRFNNFAPSLGRKGSRSDVTAPATAPASGTGTAAAAAAHHHHPKTHPNHSSLSLPAASRHSRRTSSSSLCPSPTPNPDRERAHDSSIDSRTRLIPAPETTAQQPAQPGNKASAGGEGLAKRPQPSRASSIENDLPTPTPRRENKMHQTSSRLLRMTDDERPFTRDFKDLFSTLMVSLPLTSHRVRFRSIEYTFTTDEAITNLGSLKFSQSNRMPDPKDPSRVVTTTTTTTFSMAKEMARSVCQKFLEARFIESCENKVDFNNKGSVWQLSPKGIHILERFCTRNGIQSEHVRNVVNTSRNPKQLVILERDSETDKLHHDVGTVDILFRRFVGMESNDRGISDSDSLHEFANCTVGVRMAREKNIGGHKYRNVFTGKATVDWLMDCCTMVDKREGYEVGQLFLDNRLIAPCEHQPNRDPNTKLRFSAQKQAYYYVTPHGEQVAGWVDIPTDGNAAIPTAASGVRDSNTSRTNVIIKHPSWRLLYREFLKDTMCEENLSFYLEVLEFNNQYAHAMIDKHQTETIRETLAAAYGLYNAFLAPGSPNELNIDHNLRTQLAHRMTRAVGDDQSMTESLIEVHKLFNRAQYSIFKLMASDSVPKFVKHPKYMPYLKGLDAAVSKHTAEAETVEKAGLEGQ